MRRGELAGVANAQGGACRSVPPPIHTHPTWSAFNGRTAGGRATRRTHASTVNGAPLAMSCVEPPPTYTWRARWERGGKSGGGEGGSGAGTWKHQSRTKIWCAWQNDKRPRAGLEKKGFVFDMRRSTHTHPVTAKGGLAPTGASRSLHRVLPVEQQHRGVLKRATVQGVGQ